jgi:hypothetical protein
MNFLWAGLLALLVATTLVGCGGGGGGSSDPVPEEPEEPPIDEPGPPTGLPIPPTASETVELHYGDQVGTTRWPDASEDDIGADGGTIAGLDCSTGNQHIHAHLSIFLNGEQLAIPLNVGIIYEAAGERCKYALHSHDSTGTIHIEGNSGDTLLLGQFFEIWGYTVSATKVADLEDPVIRFYVRDTGGELVERTDDPARIPLLSQRQITIQIGTPPAEIPLYSNIGGD